MAVTGLDTFDKTVHETNSWIDSVADRRAGARIQGAARTLHALRDQLGPSMAAHLGDQTAHPSARRLL